MPGRMTAVGLGLALLVTGSVCAQTSSPAQLREAGPASAGPQAAPGSAGMQAAPAADALPSSAPQGAKLPQAGVPQAVPNYVAPAAAAPPTANPAPTGPVLNSVVGTPPSTPLATGGAPNTVPAASAPPPVIGDGGKFASRTYAADTPSLAAEATNPSPVIVVPADDLYLNDLGFRVGAFSFSNSAARNSYESLDMFGIDWKHHFASSPFAVSTSLDFASGQGQSLLVNWNLGTPVSTTSTLSSIAWRGTFLLEPQPGTWGSADGNFYVTPYLGVGVGSQVWVEASTVSGQDNYGDSIQGLATAVVAGFDLHAVLGVDLVIQRRLAMGISFMSTWAEGASGSVNGQTQGGLDVSVNKLNLGGNSVCFDLSWCF